RMTIENKEGGYGWVIVAASFMMQACSFGVVSGFGVFFEYYSRVTFPSATKAELSVIGTVGPTAIAFGSVLTGRLCDLIGARFCALLGACMSGLGMLLAAFSTQIWQLALTQGLLFGLGGALVYVPANSIVADWFTHKRGMAIGLATAGSGLGGLFFSLLNDELLERLGRHSCLIINAVLLTGLLGTSALVIRPTQWRKERPPFKLATLLEPRLIVFGLAMLSAGLSFLVPIYYMPTFAEENQLTTRQGAWLVGAINLTSAIGRILIGILGDYFGHTNVFITALVLSSLSTLIWYFSTKFYPLVAFSILYGVPSGGFAGGFASTCAELFGTENLATIMGVAYAPSGLGDLIGPTLAGAIIDLTSDFRYLIIYTMALYFTSSLLIVLARLFKY
ncbi:hypothetical protein L0F63_001290, partial [Massospora cicadina]